MHIYIILILIANFHFIKSFKNVAIVHYRNMRIKQEFLLESTKKTNEILSNFQRVLTQNPISTIIVNAYSFFYWNPKKNILEEDPWELFASNTTDLIRWYQFPHNLPPYRYIEGGWPEDMFCWGLPGNTLPLGDWDPWGFQLVSYQVVKKYRESELKHGRIAMLSSIGFLMQESWHPLQPTVGGLAITHMNQLQRMSASDGLLKPLFTLLTGYSGSSESFPDGGIMLDKSYLSEGLQQVPVDFIFVLLVLCSLEIFALQRNWVRWRPNEYYHQFDHNIGLGNLKSDYENGNYGFDPLRLRPEDKAEYRDMQDKELNHGRLAMIAITAMLVQEYSTGVPILPAFQQWISDGGLLQLFTAPLEIFNAIGKLPSTVGKLYVESMGSIGSAPPPPTSGVGGGNLAAPIK